MKTYIFLEAAQDISRYIDDVYVLGSWNKVSISFHLPFCYCNGSTFSLRLIVELVMKKKWIRRFKVILLEYTLSTLSITNFEKEMLGQIILKNLIRKNFGSVNSLLNRILNKLKYQKVYKIIYESWCQKIYVVSI